MSERLRPGVTTRRFASNAEADRHDAEYWRQIPADHGCCWYGNCPSSSGSCLDDEPMNPDFVDLLRAFAAADVRFLIVGAYARRHRGTAMGLATGATVGTDSVLAKLGERPSTRWRS